MKLIDVLVRELPDLGGWPPCVDSLYQTAKGHLVGTQGCFVNTVDLKLSVVADDTHRSVRREQYEVALAARKTGCAGEGIPPIGAKCEFISNDTTWGEVSVIGFDGDKVVFKPSGETYYAIVPSNRQIFRPIRSEADKKRDEAIDSIAELCRNSASNSHSAELIYDAIKSRKIIID
ncbi:hypothetical protein CF485_21240 [Salmonella enterica subsp. enterica serovar Schwarzengrund]|nr:hypothetical protein [Salmonella enterica subsp. enterica serovar Schwarzengrund]